ncbi:MAG: hypothetical protein V1495_09335 [Pseudomonadota bacterium]
MAALSVSTAFAQLVEVRRLQSVLGSQAKEQYALTLQAIDDFDGDDLPDLLVGIPKVHRVELLSGKEYCEIVPFQSDLPDDLGWTLIPPVDVNGDGKPDFIFGIPANVPTGAEEDTRGAIAIYRSDVQADGVIRYNSQRIRSDVPGAFLGESVVWLGGPKKIFVATSPSFTGGTAYLFSALDGKRVGEVDFDFAFAHENDRKGYLAWGAPDIDHDGFRDFAIGAVGQDPTNNVDFESPGWIYLYSGKTARLLTVLQGSRPTSHLGMSFASVGDLNGDGWEEFAVGVPYQRCAGENRCGAVYILDGHSLRPPTDKPRLITIDEREPEVMFSAFGTNKNELLGFQVARFADVNGDGIPEILVAAPGSGKFRGQVQIRSGKDFTVLKIIDGDADGEWFASRLESDPSLKRIFVGSPYFSSEGLPLRGRLDVYEVK